PSVRCPSPRDRPRRTAEPPRFPTREHAPRGIRAKEACGPGVLLECGWSASAFKRVNRPRCLLATQIS
ncbi:unnamed protein product, partial [Mycena citricolor]